MTSTTDDARPKDTGGGCSAEQREAVSTIAFQGEPGAYSHLACLEAHPEMRPLPCPTFEAAFDAVDGGVACYAMIPIENSVAGRVADIHRLLPHSRLRIVGEHFQRVNHQLLGLPGATVERLRSVRSHGHALDQCRRLIAELGVETEVHADTAGAARSVGQGGDDAVAAIASTLAAEIYGLRVLRSEIEDAEHNTTRFVVLASESDVPPVGAGPTITTIMFQVRNVPAALYKALGGFATNGVNMTKLESYQLGDSFLATQFHADVEGHPEERGVALALEELRFFSTDVRIVGVYPAHAYRRRSRESA